MESQQTDRSPFRWVTMVMLNVPGKQHTSTWEVTMVMLIVPGKQHTSTLEVTMVMVLSLDNATSLLAR